MAIASPMCPADDSHLGAQGRVLGAFVAACCLALLLVAWRLDPSSRGVGTHTQLGMPPCMWMTRFGRPCATCGMTTAFSYAAHGRFLRGLRAQPLGLLLCLLTAAAFWPALHAAATGSRWDRLVVALLRPKLVWIGLVLVLGAWGYKLWAMWP